MKIVATIESRMTSSRLPGKHMLLVNDKPILSHLINRLKKVPSLNEIVLATTVNSSDEPLAQLAKSLEIKCFRGSEEDVASRVIGAGESVNADIIVEITGDCILLDPNIVEQAIQSFLTKKPDYLNNIDLPGYPVGMDVQVFALATLKKSYSMMSHPLDYEHVTRFIRKNPQIFSHQYLEVPKELYWPDLWLVLDEKADYELLKNIIEYFPNDIYQCADIIQLLKMNPQWLSEVNKIRRKGLDE